MSYDLLFKLPRTAAPLTQKQKASLAEALVKQMRGLSMTKLDYKQIAKACGITLAQARKQYSDVELIHDKHGIQIMIEPRGVSLTVAYWHGGKVVHRVFKDICSCGALLAERGYSCKDPQLGRKLDFKKDLQDMVDTYMTVIRQL